MKKSIYNIILVIVLCILILIGTLLVFLQDDKQSGSSKNYVKISIRENTWNQDGSSKKDEKEYKIKKNDVIKVNVNWSNEITFKVLNISKNSITIETSEAMSLNSINLRSKETKFKINKKGASTLHTLTMDAGASYKITFID